MKEFKIQVWDPEQFGLPETYEAALAILNVADRPVVALESQPRVHGFLLALQEAAPDCKEILEGSTRRIFKTLIKRNAGFTGIGELPFDGYPEDMERDFIFRLANRFGLVAHCNALNAVFLPGRVILSPSKIAEWAKQIDRFSNPYPETTREFRELVLPRLTEMLLFHGFRRDHSPDPDFPEIVPLKTRQQFNRVINGINQILRIDVLQSQKGRDKYIPTQLLCRDPIVSEIYNIFRFHHHTSTFSINLTGGGPLGAPLLGKSGDWELADLAALERFFVGFEQAIFPMFDIAADIRGLDRLMNGDACLPIRESCRRFFYQPQALIVARLAGNPQFEEIALELQNNTGRWGINTDARETEFPKLVNYLREHVQPLE